MVERLRFAARLLDGEKMSCVACSQSTTDPATPVTRVQLG